MNSSEERAVERRRVHVMIVLCCPSQGENLLLLGNARLKERRKDRVRMSSPFPLLSTTHLPSLGYPLVSQTWVLPYKH